MGGIGEWRGFFFFCVLHVDCVSDLCGMSGREVCLGGGGQKEQVVWGEEVEVEEDKEEEEAEEEIYRGGKNMIWGWQLAVGVQLGRGAKRGKLRGDSFHLRLWRNPVRATERTADWLCTHFLTHSHVGG